MRWVRDLALLLVIAALVGGVLVHLRRSRDQEQMVQQAAAEVMRMETEVRYRSATRSADLNTRGWPVTIDPKWFTESRPPMNLLVSQSRPWVEVAGPDQAGLLHPRARVAVEESLAAFWYNPYQGIVRARVPVMMSDEHTVEVYNRVNSCFIPSIFWHEKAIPTPDILTPTPTEQTDHATSNPSHGGSAAETSVSSDVPTDHAARNDTIANPVGDAPVASPSAVELEPTTKKP